MSLPAGEIVLYVCLLACSGWTKERRDAREKRVAGAFVLSLVLQGLSRLPNGVFGHVRLHGFAEHLLSLGGDDLRGKDREGGTLEHMQIALPLS